MRKLVLLGAVLAMVLVAAAPAFAQDIVAGDSFDVDDSFNDVTVAGAIQEVDQSIEQTQTVTGDVTGGDATATATDDSNTSASGGDATVSQDASQSAVQHANDFFFDSDRDGIHDFFDFFPFDFDNDGIDDFFDHFPFGM